jgi:enoyl-CoA hydratase/carnithine racemase
MSLADVDVSDGVAVVTLNNPPLNLFTRELTRQLGDVLLSIQDDVEIRSVVVTGSGPRAFSAGSDINEFPPLMERGTVLEEKLAFENLVFNRLASLPVPTIAAIVGAAFGGGAELALCCDYRIISDTGRIGLPEIHLGTVPGSGGLTRLPRLINPSIALALLLDGDPIGADQALEIGLVNQVAEARNCLEMAIARARKWASRPGLAVRAIKEAVCQQARRDTAADIWTSLEVSRRIFATFDMREGVAAFREKRDARFEHQ